MRVLRCQVGQRDKDDGCHSGKDELKAQFADTVNETAVAHTIYLYENIYCHHNAHTDINGDAVADPDGIYPR